MKHTYVLLVRGKDMDFAHVEFADNLTTTNYVRSVPMLRQQLKELRDEAIKEVILGKDKTITIDKILDMYNESQRILDEKEREGEVKR